ncbi:MAG: DNA glycosylase AlkZ-like family protein [Acetobacterium sp.]
MKITKMQAQKFLMHYHGLLGKHQYRGKDGVLAFINHIKAVQFDPIDVCGRSSEIVLQSRVKDFKKEMLFDLLYKDRKLVDYFDKCLCIFPASDFPYLKGRMMYYYKTEFSPEILASINEEIKKLSLEKGAFCSKDLSHSPKMDWFWQKETRLSKAVIEDLYYKCVLGISFKKGTLKYYALIEKCIEKDNLEPHIFASDHERFKWHIYRRICSVGLIWNKASAVWLNIGNLNAKERSLVFEELLADHLIKKVIVDTIDEPFYYPAKSEYILDDILQGISAQKRCEFIAPLDNLIWDRNFIKTLFGFDYKWEIYLPKEKRQFGYYILPIIYGHQFIGRIEIICDRKTSTLKVANIWFEDGIRKTKTMATSIDNAIKRFAKFNACNTIIKTLIY